MSVDGRCLPLKWAAVFASFGGSTFCLCAVGMAGTWPGLLWCRKDLWWLDLICSARLVGLMFNMCCGSSIHIRLIGSNRIIHLPYPLGSSAPLGSRWFVGQRHEHRNATLSCKEILVSVGFNEIKAFFTPWRGHGGAAAAAAVAVVAVSPSGMSAGCKARGVKRENTCRKCL